MGFFFLLVRFWWGFFWTDTDNTDHFSCIQTQKEKCCQRSFTLQANHLSCICMSFLTHSCLLKASRLAFIAKRKSALKMKAEVATGSFQVGENKYMKCFYIWILCLWLAFFFFKSTNSKIRNRNIFSSFIEFFSAAYFQAFYTDTDFWQPAYTRGMCTSLHESVDKRKKFQQWWEPRLPPHAYALAAECICKLLLCLMAYQKKPQKQNQSNTLQ